MLDRVWILCHPTYGLYHAPSGTDAFEAWSKARKWTQVEEMTTLTTKWYTDMREIGWRAKKVEISYEK